MTRRRRNSFDYVALMFEWRAIAGNGDYTTARVRRYRRARRLARYWAERVRDLDDGFAERARRVAAIARDTEALCRDVDYARGYADAEREMTVSLRLRASSMERQGYSVAAEELIHAGNRFERGDHRKERSDE